MNKKIKKFIKIFKSINLSEKEKSILRYKISEFISFNPIRSNVYVPKKSFYFSIFTFRTMSKTIAMVLVAILVVGGSSVSYASTDALPGDALYPVKINVNEKIEEKLAFTSEAKVNVQTEKVERRLSEAKTLSDKKELSPENKKIVNENLKKNVENVTKTIETLKDEGNIELALETTSKITPVLEAHREVLVENKDKEDKEEAENNAAQASLGQTSTMSVIEDEPEEDSLIEAVDAAIKKVEAAETKVIEKATENKESADKVTEKNTLSVEQKIEDMKKANAEATENKESEKAKVEIEILETEEKDTENKSETSELTNKGEATIMSSDLATETKLLTPVQKIVVNPEIIEKATAKIVAETDVEIRIRVAEELLKKADEEKIAGNYKEALKLSQLAKKIIQQIEEYNKIKALEVKNENTLEAKAEIKAPAKTTTEAVKPAESKPAATNTEVKTGTEIKTPVPVTPTEKPLDLTSVELEAAAIKSLEETNAYFKKINLNQSVQNRLLP